MCQLSPATAPQQLKPASGQVPGTGSDSVSVDRGHRDRQRMEAYSGCGSWEGSCLGSDHSTAPPDLGPVPTVEQLQLQMVARSGYETNGAVVEQLYQVAQIVATQGETFADATGMLHAMARKGTRSCVKLSKLERGKYDGIGKDTQQGLFSVVKTRSPFAADGSSLRPGTQSLRCARSIRRVGWHCGRAQRCAGALAAAHISSKITKTCKLRRAPVVMGRACWCRRERTRR